MGRWNSGNLLWYPLTRPASDFTWVRTNPQQGIPTFLRLIDSGPRKISSATPDTFQPPEPLIHLAFYSGTKPKNMRLQMMPNNTLMDFRLNRGKGMQRFLTGWTAEDFADTSSQQIEDDDPWAVDTVRDAAVGNSSSSDIEVESDNVPAGWDDVAPTDTTRYRDLVESETGDSDRDEHDDIELFNSDTTAELAAVLEWDEAPGSGNEVAEAETLVYTRVDGSFPSDPVPQAEYDSELRQPLYELQYDNLELLREVKVNEWVASIDDVSNAQVQEITDILLGLSRPRLRSWLPWLRGQQWTGRLLLLFLQFRAYWDENPQFWESSFWDWKFACWRPTWSAYALSRDSQFDLVQQRLDYAPAEIINRTWFDEWERFALWKHGYEAFADFALLRAGLTDRDDWRNYVDWSQSIFLTENEPLFENARREDILTPQSHSKFRQTFWFVSQDWYDPAEWHDGLGW